MLFAFSFSALQHEQQPSFFPPAVGSVSAGSAVLATLAFVFIGQDSPPLQQQSSSQHDADTPPVAVLLFIGHESPLQQQHSIAALFVNVARWYATAAIAIPRMSRTEITSRILFLILVTSLYLQNLSEPVRSRPARKTTCWDTSKF
jgi:hypothetical protein